MAIISLVDATGGWDDIYAPLPLPGSDTQQDAELNRRIAAVNEERRRRQEEYAAQIRRITDGTTNQEMEQQSVDGVDDATVNTSNDGDGQVQTTSQEQQSNDGVNDAKVEPKKDGMKKAEKRKCPEEVAGPSSDTPERYQRRLQTAQEDYMRRITDTQVQTINQEMDRQNIEGLYNGVVDRNEEGTLRRHITIIGDTLRNQYYSQIATLHYMFEGFISALQEVGFVLYSALLGKHE